jgi:hypothetical protein
VRPVSPSGPPPLSCPSTWRSASSPSNIRSATFSIRGQRSLRVYPGRLAAPKRPNPERGLIGCRRRTVHPRWSYCFEDVCVPGFPPTAPPHIGDPDIVVVEFAPSEWSFIATFVPADGKCQRAGLDPSGDGRFMLVPVGATETYDVTLFGKGDGGLVVTFRWTTPRDGPPGDLRSVSQPCQRALRRSHPLDPRTTLPLRRPRQSRTGGALDEDVAMTPHDTQVYE